MPDVAQVRQARGVLGGALMRNVRAVLSQLLLALAIGVGGDEFVDWLNDATLRGSDQ